MAWWIVFQKSHIIYKEALNALHSYKSINEPIHFNVRNQRATLDIAHEIDGRAKFRRKDVPLVAQEYNDTPYFLISSDKVL